MEWTRISDKLPEEFTLNLTFGMKVGFQIAEYLQKGHWDPYGHNGLGNYWNLQFITHWMPLPKKPRRENE